MSNMTVVISATLLLIVVRVILVWAAGINRDLVGLEDSAGHELLVMKRPGGRDMSEGFRFEAPGYPAEFHHLARHLRLLK